MKPTADQYFIEKAMLGDTRAFGTLVERYQDYIFTLVYRMLRCREEAEEVAQDTFLKAFEALSQFRGEAKFSTWLYRIAYRKSLDRLRLKKKHDNTLELREEITGSQVEDLETGLEYMLQAERAEMIRKCIMQLPEQEAAIVTLYYMEEQSVKEIRQITGLTEDNIKVKLYRSRKLLFSLLENYISSTIPEKNGKAI